MDKLDNMGVFQILILWKLFLPLLVSAARSSMKVVEAPSNVGFQQPFHQTSYQSLQLRVPPSNFSGPQHLEYLKGQCYTKVVGDYRYELCPFNNVTQHEIVLRWNSYSGVIGVWRDWEIQNNTFMAMNMPDGDSCGSAYRSVKVFMVCGTNSTYLANVTEPSTCAYEITLISPLVCLPESMLVYPTLPEHFRNDWDELEGLLEYGEITQTGYDRRLRKLFIDAGYVVEAGTVVMEQERMIQTRKLDQGHFDSLMECQIEYRKLKKRTDDLMKNISDIETSQTT